jgi:RNA polymerase sigma-70 factor (ECF subfamily)
LVQDIWLAAWRAIGNVKADGSFVGWLHTIARHNIEAWAKANRSIRKEVQLDETVVDAIRQCFDRSNLSSPDALAEKAEVAQLVRAAIAEVLEPREREVVNQRYFMCQKYGELAMDLGITEDAARQIAHRARAKLWTRLKDVCNRT